VIHCNKFFFSIRVRPYPCPKKFTLTQVNTDRKVLVYKVIALREVSILADMYNDNTIA